MAGWRVSIKGIQEAQRANIRHIAAMKPGGGFGRAIQYATIQAHRYATSITHVDTGSLKASHRMDVSGLRGRVYIDPSSPGIRGRTATTRRSYSTKQRPSVYGPFEHGRGGKHAFYQRTREEHSSWLQRAKLVGYLRGEMEAR